MNQKDLVIFEVHKSKKRVNKYTRKNQKSDDASIVEKEIETTKPIVDKSTEENSNDICSVKATPIAIKKPVVII